MDKIIGAFKDAFLGFGFADALFVILLTALIYYMLIFLRRNNAAKLSIAILVVIFVLGLISLSGSLISGSFFQILVFIIIALVFIVFSPEFKRDIWNIKKLRFSDLSVAVSDSLEIERCISEIIKALQNMSKGDIGAIIILTRGTVPPQILESGVILESEISSQIIESVFFPKAPLHDGAMLISGKKILAAGCFLPLSQEINLPKELGTRHRAGIGITETLSVTALIVSEETGIISIAQSGKLTRYADSDMLKEKLKEYYWQHMLLSDKKRR